MASPKELLFNYTSPKGCEYKLSFSIFQTTDFKISIEIYDVVLKRINDLGDDSQHVLSFVVKQTLKFIEEQNCIIYLYCDRAPISKANRNRDLSNQEFRSKLFNALFETSRRRSIRECETFNFVIRNIEIPDSIHGNHFISLISHVSNIDKLEELKTTIFTLNEKG